MKKLKKICALMCAAAMLCSIGAGCSKKNGENGDVTTVEIWSGDSHSKDVYTKLINEYNTTVGKEKGIFIDYQLKENNYSQLLELALQNGDAPDFITGALPKLVENDNVISLDRLPGGQEFVDEFIKKYGESSLMLTKNKYNGKVYSIPTQATTQGLLYNIDMFQAAGIVDGDGNPIVPKTFDEMRETAKKLTDASKKQYGIILPLKWSGWFASDISAPMQSTVGHQGFDPTTGAYDYSGLVPIMKSYLGMKDDGSVFPGEEGIDNDTARAYFSEGNIGMKIGFSFDVRVLCDQFPAKIKWGVAPLPVVDENNTYMQRGSYGGSMFVNKKALDTVGGEKLMEVLKFMSGNDFIRELYREGAVLPYDWNTVSDIDVSEKTGWKEFGEIAKISSNYTADPPVDMGANAKIGERFVSEVWSGKSTPEALCEDYKKVMTDVTQKYFATNSNDKIENYLDADWLTRNKR